MIDKLLSKIVYFLLFRLWFLKIERWPKVGDFLMDWWYSYDMEQQSGIMSCQDCGRLIDWDIKVGDDIIRPAYVTASGDLCCDWCGSRYDREEEEDDYSYDDGYDDDGEPDFTLDDIEWDETYPELSE